MSQFTAVSFDQFAQKAWTRGSYAFVQRDHLIPIFLAELVQVVTAMPVVFVAHGDGYQLMGLASPRPGSNLFVSAEGQWLVDYVPAAIRTYPFRLIKSADSDDHVLCFDADSERLVDAGRGEAFFNADGALAKATQDILSLLTLAERSRQSTQRAVDALSAAGVIKPWPLSIRDGATTLKSEGLFRVDESTLNALPDNAFSELRKSGALALAYAHLVSLNQMSQFAKLLQVQAHLRKTQAPQSDRVPDANELIAALAEGETLKFC